MRNLGSLTLLAILLFSQAADLCTTGILKSNPEQKYGKKDLRLLTIPNATIAITIYLSELDLGNKNETISDPCAPTGAQTDINHITITSGEDVLFYCGGIRLVKPGSFKRAITSPENTVLVSMTSSLDQPRPGSYQFFYELTSCPDIEGGVITRRNRSDGQSSFYVHCREGWTGSEGTFICQEDGSWSTEPSPPSCQPIRSTSSATTVTTAAHAIESTVKEGTTTTTSSKEPPSSEFWYGVLSGGVGGILVTGAVTAGVIIWRKKKKRANGDDSDSMDLASRSPNSLRRSIDYSNENDIVHASNANTSNDAAGDQFEQLITPTHPKADEESNPEPPLLIRILTRLGFKKSGG